jgi:hypothetical protein
MIVLTQSYRESGLKGLEPIGPVRAKVSYIKDYIQDVCEEAAKQMPFADYIFKAKFKWFIIGHPSNGDNAPGNGGLWGCVLIGDAYKKKKELGFVLKQLPKTKKHGN